MALLGVTTYRWVNILKLLIFAASVGYIYYTFNNSDTNWAEALYLIHIQFGSSTQYLYLFAAIILIPVNWSTEALKWYLLSKKVIPNVRYYDALKGVLSGVCLGFLTPHALGDYLARVSFLDGNQNRTDALAGVLVARMCQFYITLFYGVIGFAVYYQFKLVASDFFNPVVFGGLLLAGFLSAYVLLQFKFLIAPVIRPLLQKPLFKWLNTLQIFTTSDYLIACALSLFRFLIFTVQYILILIFFDVDVHLLVVCGIWLVYLAKSVFPSFNFLNDLGVREASALFILAPLGIAPTVIIVSGLTLWFLNLFIPFLAGLVIVIQYRVPKDHYEGA